MSEKKFTKQDFVKAVVSDITGQEIDDNKTLHQVVEDFEVRGDSPLLMSQDIRGQLSALQAWNTSTTPSINMYQIKQSVLWSNTIWRIGQMIIDNNVFTSFMEQFKQPMETAGDVYEFFMNIKNPLHRPDLANSDLFTNFTDDVKTAFHRLNYQWVIPTTFNEEEIRKIVTTWDTLTTKIAASITNLTKSYQRGIQEAGKGMIFDFFKNGLIPTVVDTEIGDSFISALNIVIDEFQSEIDEYYIPYNNQIAPQLPLAMDICNRTPVVITFTDLIRNAEFENALELNFGRDFKTGHTNEDYTRGGVIMLPRRNFPNDYTPDYVPSPLWEEVPYTRDDIIAIIADPQAILFYEQFQFMLNWQNIITLNTTHALHTDFLLSLAMYRKICVIVRDVEGLSYQAPFYTNIEKAKAHGIASLQGDEFVAEHKADKAQKKKKESNNKPPSLEG